MTEPSRTGSLAHRRPTAGTHQWDLFDRPSGRTAILLYSGFVFDLASPDASGMPIEDIARALAHQPRWGGACREFYSVAEHCLHASLIGPDPYGLDLLLHDCEEFLGDIPSPAKAVLGKEALDRLFKPVKLALAREFRFRTGLAVVKQVDLVCMATELRDLMPKAWMDWGHLPEPHPIPLRPVGPDRAYQLFLDRYEQLRRR